MSKEATVNTESEMLDFGRTVAKSLTPPVAIELVGDVGAGKTTFTRGLAEGLGVKTPVTSPSFTISKLYAFPGGTLAHYDFYRLPDPGLMSEDLLESLQSPDMITVVEWADTVSNLLPVGHRRFTITLNKDGSRTIKEEVI